MNQDNKDYFQGKGIKVGNVRCLSSRDALSFLQDSAVLVDIRKEYEINYRLFDVPEVIYSTPDQLEEALQAVPNETPLIVADNVGVRSKDVAVFLMEKGFANTASLTGGIVEWVKSGSPVKIDRDFELNGQCSCKLKPRKRAKKMGC